MAGMNFFPYRTVADLRLETEVDPRLPRGTDGSLHAFALADDFTAVFTVSLDDPVISTLVPISEQDDPPIEVSLRMSSIESRHRGMIPMQKVGSTYESPLHLSSSNFAGTLLVNAVVARTTFAHEPEAGLAIDRGSMIAWSEPVPIRFTEQTTPPGKFLDPLWLDFSQSEDPWLNQNTDALFVVEPGSELPKLFLNSSFHPDIRTILDSRGTTGRAARVRDAAFAFVAQGGWTSLLSIVLSDVREAVDDASDLDASEALANVPMEWKRSVFLDWAPELFPDVTPPAEARQYVEALISVDMEELMTKRLSVAIQTRFGGSSKFGSLITELLTQ